MSTPWYAIVAICISVLALVVATKNYRRKAGILVRGSFETTGSIDCSDKFISGIILDNLKDRAITIFSIYIRFGYNYYIKLEDFESKPLLLKAYESYRAEYGSIQFYGINSKRIDLNNLFRDPKLKKRLVLSTADGKYIVPATLKQWSPIWDFFGNHLTAVITPVRTRYKDAFFGSNIRYIIEFFDEKGSTEIVLIHPEDHSIRKFVDFNLTQECLASEILLSAFLDEQLKAGKLKYATFVVHDAHNLRKRRVDFYSGGTLVARKYSFVQYHIIGRLLTREADKRMKQENETRQRPPADA